MATYFIADTHFGHANIIKYCSRPFLSDEEERLVREAHGDRDRLRDVAVSRASVERMDQTMLDHINAVVGPDDTLWHLGDFTFGDYEKAEGYRRRIRCRNVHLIWGNHDRRPAVAPLFGRTYDQVMVRVEGQLIFLNHYAMRVWDRSHRGAWHLYGHSHGRLPEDPSALAFDIGVDCHDFRPWSFDEIRERMARKLPRRPAPPELEA
jgi:calcineurin-like phosphoesterase family protein